MYLYSLMLATNLDKFGQVSLTLCMNACSVYFVTQKTCIQVFGVHDKTIDLPTAANRCEISVKTLRRDIDRGIFTTYAPRGRGHGRKLFVYADEIDAYKRDGYEGVIKLRAKKRRRKSA